MLISLTVVIAQKATPSTRKAGRWRAPPRRRARSTNHGPTVANSGSLNRNVSRADVTRRPASNRGDDPR